MRTILLAVAGTALAMAVGMTFPAAHSADTGTIPARSIAVTADGTVQIAPDIAFLTVGVVKTDIEAAAAQSAANAVAARAIAGLKALGIPDRDLQTSGVTLNPQYDNSGTLTGFQATDTVAVTVERLSQAGKVIDTAVAAGANQSLSITFGLKDPSSAQSAALKAAIVIAQRKATVAATQMGVSLVGARFQLAETNSQLPQPVYATAQRSMVSVPAPSNPTPIQAGTLTIDESVSLTYTF